MPFLDMLIKRESNAFITSVYRKETHTQRYIHWKSNHSQAVKLGVLKGLIHRAHLLCDLKDDLLDELNLLKDVFVSNGYPYKLVNKTVNESWSSELKKWAAENFEEEDDKKEKNEYFEVLHAPYVHGFTERLQKELKTFGIGFVMKKGTTLASVLCKLKQKTEKEQKKNMDYIIKCKTCDMKYVGETGQQFHTRKQQHQRDVKNRVSTNGIYNHLKNNKKHKIGWDDAVFIDREPHFMRRKIKESIYINALDPSEKHSKIMNLEKGIATNPCWNEFNSEVRKILRL